MENINVKLYEVEKEIANHTEESGNVTVVDKKIRVATLGGYLFLTLLQIPGKRRMKYSNY